jgi:hypothetical protein
VVIDSIPSEGLMVHETKQTEQVKEFNNVPQGDKSFHQRNRKDKADQND